MTVEETEEVQETTEVDETTEEAPNDGGLTKEELVKELAKVRKEAAARRVKSRESEEKAQKWEEHLRAQKTDLERLTEDKNKIEQEANELRLENLRTKVALETKLDPELVQFLSGTEEEMKATAKLLLSKSSNGVQHPANFFAGPSGSPVNAKPDETLNEWFAREWRDADLRKSI